ncbi:MAG: branched-chain amino acid transport system permease protein [Candidatus Peregrinibacteria bacterium Gr01-1014_25]|nr:MAG: branched-chain amino acid transport system permease protein [Candidatus Peregrinibacteria bacterium Gr01-1014_25]
MNYLWHILAVVMIQMPSALGYNVVFGKGKILHFGPIATSLASAYLIFLLLKATGSWGIAVAAGCVGAALLSVLFAWISQRLEPDGFGVLSLAVHLGIVSIVLNWSSVTRGALGVPQIPSLPLITSLPRVALLATGVAMAWGGLLFWLHRRAFGRQLAALAEHEWHASALGVNRFRMQCAAFLLAGFGALLSNLQFAPYIHLLHPSDYGFPALINLVLYVIAGGPGNILGVALATVLLVTLHTTLPLLQWPAGIIGPVRLILFGTILFVVIWLRAPRIFPQRRSV